MRMSDSEQIRAAEKFKADGNELFKAKDYKHAEDYYRQALLHAQSVKDDTSPELKTLKKTILQNMSVCTNNTGYYKGTVEQCSQALELDSQAQKALYLRSVAYSKLLHWEESLADIVAAIKLSPNDKNLRQHHAAVKDGMAKAKNKQKGAFAQMFKQDIYAEAEKQQKAEPKEP